MLTEIREETPASSLNIISIRRAAENKTGQSAELPLSQTEIKSALNKLLEKCQKAKKMEFEDSFHEADDLKKVICSDFRIIIERVIENDLLCGVVERFRRAVQTRRKLKDLAKITPEDCAYLDDLMTKYSAYVHSAPSERPTPLPSAEDLRTDIEELREWRVSFKRKAAYKL